MVSYLASLSFYSPPLSKPTFQFQAIRTWKLTDRMLQRRVTKRAANKLLWPGYFNGGISITNWSNQFYIALPSRQFHQHNSHHINGVSSGAQILISGFWVGPDIEDGWGYVEAFVLPNC